MKDDPWNALDDYENAIVRICRYFDVQPDEAEEILIIYIQSIINPGQSVLYPERRPGSQPIIPIPGMSKGWWLIEKVYLSAFAVTVYCTQKGNRFIADIQLISKPQVNDTVTYTSDTSETGPPK